MEMVKRQGLSVNNLAVTRADGTPFLRPCAFSVGAGQAVALIYENAPIKSSIPDFNAETKNAFGKKISAPPPAYMRRLFMKLLSAGTHTGRAVCDESALLTLKSDGRTAYVADLGRPFGFMTAGEYLRYAFAGLRLESGYVGGRIAGIAREISLPDCGAATIKRMKDFEYLLLNLAVKLWDDPDTVLLTADTLRYSPAAGAALSGAVRGMRAAGRAVIVNLADARFMDGAFDGALVLSPDTAATDTQRSAQKGVGFGGKNGAPSDTKTDMIADGAVYRLTEYIPTQNVKVAEQKAENTKAKRKTETRAEKDGGTSSGNGMASGNAKTDGGLVSDDAKTDGGNISGDGIKTRVKKERTPPKSIISVRAEGNLREPAKRLRAALTDARVAVRGGRLLVYSDDALNAGRAALDAIADGGAEIKGFRIG
jgi:hypothetical protein